MRAAEEIVWAGGEHSFRLGIGELRAIEQACDAGVSVVLFRLLGSQWKVDDVVSPIRLGLVGGGMAEIEAKKLVGKITGETSLYELSVTAADILRRFIMWDDGDAPGEQKAGKETHRPRSETEKPDGQAIIGVELQ